MTSTLLPSPGERRLARELASLRADIDTVQQALRTPQLGNSTLFGAIPMRDAATGEYRGSIGQQDDGTFAVVNRNGPPPSRPATPIVTPSMNGIIVEWNGQLVSGVPADFSHVNVYVSTVEAFITGSTNQVGSLLRSGSLPVGPLVPGTTYYVRFRAASTSLNDAGVPIEGEESFQSSAVAGAVVAGAVIAGIINDLALAADAVTKAKIAANAVDGTKIEPNSISSPHVVAGAIQALHVAADAIAAGSVAADVITARELAALAVVAEHINTNAINAGHLQAGIIDADKLTAMLVLATRIILGDPVGARLEIDETGLDQFDEAGSRTMQFGANPSGGNFLTIVDPLTQGALAAITDGGVMAAQSFMVAGSMSYQGDELETRFASLPKGVLAWGTVGTSPYTTSTIGVAELDVQAERYRIYRISHSAGYCEPSALGSSPTAQGELRIHYTLDGSRPTTSSPILTATGRSAPGDYGDVSANWGQIQTGPDAARIRLLFTYWAWGGVSSRLYAANSHNNMLFWIEDAGPTLTAGGVPSTGGGTGATASTTYTREYAATWSRSWNNGGAGLRFTDGEMVQGYYNDGVNGDQMAAFGFNDATIRANLAGSTIVSVDVYLYAHHWYWNSGGYARIRTHNSAATNTYPTVSTTVDSEPMGKPEGKWIRLPNSVGDGFRNGTVKGFALDSRDVARDLINYGRFDGIGWASPPRLRITYRSSGTGGTPVTDPVGDVNPPTNFTAVWNGNNTVTVNWTPGSGVDSTEVHEFRTDPADTLKATIAYPGGTRTSGTLTAGQTYAYAVRSRRGSEVSAFTNTITISNTGQSTGSTTGNAVAVPTNVAVTVNSDRSVTTTWTPTPGSTATEVHEMLATPSDTLRATVAYPGSSRTSGVLTGGRWYSYAVRAVAANGLSQFSTAITVGVPDENGNLPTGPPPPGGGGTGTVGGTQTLGVGGIPTAAAGPNTILGSGSSGSTLSITTDGKIYDGQGKTVQKIDIAADGVTVQNYYVRGAGNSGIYSLGSNNTIQNCDIANVNEGGVGDINAITFFGNGTKILYNNIDNLVGGDPGGSHTDGIQCWATPSKGPSSDVQIVGNRVNGPVQSNPAYIHQGVMAEGPASQDGGGGASGNSARWLVADNYFKTYGNQAVKFDDIDEVDITRNTFAGSATKIVEKGSISTGVRYYSDNVVTGSYGSTGVTVISGSGPASPGGAGTGGGGGTPTTGGSTPGSIYSMARWYLTLPIADPSGVDTSGPWDVYNPELATFKHASYFFVDGSGWVNYVAPVAGVTTSSASGATRSELREMFGPNRADKASWGFNDGKSHVLEVTMTCDATSVSGRKECIVGQIHDAGTSPPIYLAVNQNSSPGVLTLFKNGPSQGTLLSGISPTTVFTYRLEVSGTGSSRRCLIFAAVGDTPGASPKFSYPVSDFSAQSSGCYLKAGAYNKEPISGSGVGRSIVRHKRLVIA